MHASRPERCLNSVVALRGSFVLPISGEPIEGAEVAIWGDQIVEVGAATCADRRVELPGAIILPGLINLHAHLEFSDLESPLGQPGCRFCDWVPLVVHYRRGTSSAARSEAVRHGLARSLRSGVTTICEIAQSDWNPLLFKGGPRAVVLREIIALDDTTALATLEATEKELGQSYPDEIACIGLSPHAPYSTTRLLVENAVRLAWKYQSVVSMHIAESPEEVEFVRSGVGCIHEMLTSLGVSLRECSVWGSFGQILHLLCQAPRSLIVHGNYLSAAELEFMARHKDRMTLVHCPRSHRFFGFDSCTVENALRLGVRVALGSDSAASGGTPEFWKDVQEFSRRFEVAPEQVLRMVTATAAEAIGLSDTIGTLDAGKAADLCIVDTSLCTRSDPYARLLERAARPIATLVSGGLRWAHFSVADRLSRLWPEMG